MLTKEQLLENQAGLQEQLGDLQQDVIAVRGALQNCDYLITLCDEEPNEEPEEGGGAILLPMVYDGRSY